MQTAKPGTHARVIPKAPDASRARLLRLSGIITLRAPAPSTKFLEQPRAVDERARN